ATDREIGGEGFYWALENRGCRGLCQWVLGEPDGKNRCPTMVDSSRATSTRALSLFMRRERTRDASLAPTHRRLRCYPWSRRCREEYLGGATDRRRQSLLSTSTDLSLASHDDRISERNRCASHRSP